MTQPPHPGPLPPSEPRWSDTEQIDDGLPPTPPGPQGSARRWRRGVVVAGVAAGALVLGGTGYAAASYLSGGGPQPEEVLPADTLAVAKLDLDPAAGQKAAMASLLAKFPDLGTSGDEGDLRSALVTPLLEGDSWGLSYDSDVEPWLGDRVAVAAVPDPGSEIGVAPVVVLAVTDQDAMSERLGAVVDDEFAFAVRDDFVLISETQQTVDRLVATESTLAEDTEYTGDLAALDGDQVAVAWADLTGLQDLLGMPVPAPDPAGAGLGDQPLSGRMVLGVHAESDALEVVGLSRGATAPTGPAVAAEPTRLALDLPEDTLAAVSISGLGEAAVQAWTAVEAAGLPPEYQEEIAAMGLDLPADLRAVFGSDLAVAVLGDVSAPAFGVRAVSDEPQRALQVLSDALSDPQLAVPISAVALEDGYAAVTDEAQLDALTRDGRLGDTETFRAAVADPDTAGAIGFVDLGAIVDQLAEQGGDTAAEAERFAALDALGFSSTTTDDGGRFVLRVTTR